MRLSSHIPPVHQRCCLPHLSSHRTRPVETHRDASNTDHNAITYRAFNPGSYFQFCIAIDTTVTDDLLANDDDCRRITMRLYYWNIDFRRSTQRLYCQDIVYKRCVSTCGKQKRPGECPVVHLSNLCTKSML